jgi:hypothetical protein
MLEWPPPRAGVTQLAECLLPKHGLRARAALATPSSAPVYRSGIRLSARTFVNEFNTRSGGLSPLQPDPTWPVRTHVLLKVDACSRRPAGTQDGGGGAGFRV